MNMPEYIWIYDKRQGSEYVSYNTYREVILLVDEYLQRQTNSESAQRSKIICFGKIILVFNYFFKKLRLKSLRGF